MFIVLTSEQADQVRCVTINPIQVGDIFIVSPNVLNDPEQPEDAKAFLATLPQEDVQLPTREL